MRVELTSSDAPVGTPLGGRVFDCAPGALIEATSTLHDEGGEAWTARGVFTSDRSGVVDFAVAASLSGTFSGVDQDGLFWSAQPNSADTRLPDMLAGRVDGGLVPTVAPLAALVFEVAFRDTTTGNTEIRKVVRRRLAQNVRKSVLPAPLCGLLFEPETPNGAGVIVLGGSEGGVFPGRAALLAAEGFTTLALAYFAHPGRPDAAVELPMAYFGRALEWLSAREGISHTGIIGVSRGSEEAQLMVINAPNRIDCLIAWVPSHLIHRAIDLEAGQDFMTETRAMWSQDGHALEGIAFCAADVYDNRVQRADFQTPGGRRYRETFARAWQQTGAEAFRIPIERYGGPVLAVGGADDALWPSDVGAERVIDAARSRNEASDLLICPSAGHLIGTPGEPRPYPYVMHWGGGYMGIDNGFCAYGGTPEGAAIAARTSWKAALDFLHEHLCR
ncbi:MAG: acyl-CoA thioesterase/bile acid-CoA:amino acid N-acyltransferase family protein [Pseudomonadota bacterium]